MSDEQGYGLLPENANRHCTTNPNYFFAAWHHDYKVEDYSRKATQAHVIILQKRLQRSMDIEWDDHMKTNANT
jgi:hypothetical protein